MPNCIEGQGDCSKVTASVAIGGDSHFIRVTFSSMLHTSKLEAHLTLKEAEKFASQIYSQINIANGK